LELLELVMGDGKAFFYFLCSIYIIAQYCTFYNSVRGITTGAICYTTNMYLGIDIGGTKTLIGRFTKDGELQESLKFPTPEDYQDFLKELTNAIARITTKPWKLACVAAPGKIDREEEIVIGYGNLRWKNTPLSADIHSIVNCDVLMENDAKLAGLSEARLLKPLPHKVLYVTISTGIGGALVVDGTLDEELEDSEIGWMLHEREGKMVPWESFASGKAITRRFNKMASEITDPHVWKLISHDIALGLIDVSAVIQPDIIIIGGGVGSHFAKFKAPLRAALKAYESPLVEAPKVVGAKNPEQAVLLGCYQLMKDNLKARTKVHAGSAR
jgi:glucokinase